MPTPLKIQLRIAGEYNSNEPPIMGEPRWDSLKSRFGVYNTGNTIKWYPIVEDGKIVLNNNQYLTGLTSTDQPNNIKLDFSVANEFRIIDTITNTVIARFNATGAYLNSTFPEGTSSIPFSNLVANASLIKKRTFSSPQSLTSVGSLMVAPNWYVWRNSSPSSVGNITFEWSPSEVQGGSSFIKLDVNQAPNSAGIRHFIPCENLNGKSITLSAYYRGTAGKKLIMRALTPSAPIISKVITLTGNLQKESITFNVPNDQSVIFFDGIYSPSFDNAAQTYIYYGAPMANLGAVALPFDERPAHMEAQLLSSFYSSIRYKSASLVDLNNPIPLIGNNYSVIANDTFTISNSSPSGLTLNISNPNAQYKNAEIYSFFSTSETI